MTAAPAPLPPPVPPATLPPCLVTDYAAIRAAMRPSAYDRPAPHPAWSYDHSGEGAE